MPLPYPCEPPDRSRWGEGPWQKEPPSVSWADDRTGLNCAMILGFDGTWRGYVAVDATHPLYQKGHSDRVRLPQSLADLPLGEIGRDYGVMDLFLEALHRREENDDKDDDTVPITLALPAHGGITYSSGSEDGLWWFGFDCSHGGDLVPLMETLHRAAGFPQWPIQPVYRDRDYVHGIVTRLAWMLKAWAEAVASETAASGEATS